MVRTFSAILVCVLGLAAHVHGDYTLAPVLAGGSSADVYINTADRTITLELVLTSDASPADAHTSAVFSVAFSKPGLQYDGYWWDGAYATDGPDDHGTPDNAAVPALLDAGSYVDPAVDDGLADFRLENFVADGNDVFETGVIATVTFTIPEGFPLGPVTITAMPDTFDDGEGSIPTTGAALTVNVRLMGDINNDGLVGGADLDMILTNWGKTVGPENAAADVDGDGIVGGSDLDAVLGYWGDNAPPPSPRR